MRILLASNALYFPAHGGGERSNRTLLEALVERGHTCRVVTRLPQPGADATENYLQELAMRQVPALSDAGTVTYELGGVTVEVDSRAANFRQFFSRRAAEFAPDVILTSTDDPAQILLGAALESPTAITVFLARATIALPFGPDAAFPNATRTRLLGRADGIVGVSEYVAAYIRQHGPLPAVHVPIALPDREPFGQLGAFDNPLVTMVNPCAVKGLSIFVALARALPQYQFGAVPSWGTTEADVALLETLPNVTLRPRTDTVDALLARTRVLLVPSLWAEARSRIVVEAMSAGVPVIASNLGGLPEAKMHVPYLLPVNPVTAYEPRLDEQMVPKAAIPAQDLQPWRAALERLLTDAGHWRALAEQSRAAALRYGAETTVVPFERYVQALPPKSSSRGPVPAHLPAPDEQRRRLLARKLKERGQQPASSAARVLPAGGAAWSALPRVFFFPHAGGAASTYRWLRSDLKEVCDVAPVQYPGRENRRDEPLPADLLSLAAQLADELSAYLTPGFVFAGHSMGAVAGFEVARLLQRRGAVQPTLLIVSAARSPRFRLDHRPGPDPSREQLAAELERLGYGEAKTPHSQLADWLPIVEADARMYRHYCFRPEAPLSMPVLALGGVDDEHVTRVHLEAWADITTAGVQCRQFPGGHFYWRAQPRLLSDSIASALRTTIRRGVT